MPDDAQATTAPDTRPVVSWLHIGDLHLTEAGLQNHRDFERIVVMANALPDGAVDFALLPGDSAEDGTAAQFALVRDTASRLALPLHIVPGDHDFEARSLDAYHDVLGAARLPNAHTIRGRRCLFLDVVSAGTGGPDFRLADEQLDWTEREIDQAGQRGEDVLVFMHTYPADLRAGGERLMALLARPHVRCVDMGHTHYNEVANDGGTIFMATRSTGQIEEGPAGVSVAALDAGVVSWRFMPLDQGWPLVLVTSPADRRLATGAAQACPGPTVVRAKVLGDAPVVAVEVVSGEALQPMTAVAGSACLWQASIVRAAGQPLRVRARDAQGRMDEDVIEPAGSDRAPPSRPPDGSDAHRVGAWPERGLLDTQLGPNRNGRAW